MNKYRWIDKLLLPLTWISVFALLFSYLAYFLKPSLFVSVSFLGLAYPILLLIVLLWFLFWLFRFKRILIIPLLSVLVGWGHLSAFFPWGGNEALSDGNKNIRVTSLNSRFFDQSYWDPDFDLLGALDQFFRAEQAHIIALQEFNPNRTVPTLENKEYIRTRGKSKLAIYSKLPVVSSGDRLFPSHISYGSNGFQWIDVLFSGDTLRIYNCHISSNQLEHSQVELIEKVDEITTDKINSKWGAMYTLLKTGFLFREKQIEELRAHIDLSPYPVLVVGDFNDTPTSHAYKQMTQTLTDAYRSHGRGWGKTYRKSLIPLRIDYHFHDEYLESNFVKVKKVEVSDHYPLIGHYSWSFRD